MNQHLSSARLKATAREQLLGHYGTAISAEMAALSIMFAASIICSALTDQTSAAGIAISYIISFILEMINGIFLFGLTRFYLNLICGQPCRAADIFYGFRSHADRAIAVRFFQLLLDTICILPALLCLFLYTAKQTAWAFLLFCIFGVIGGIGTVIITLMYSQAYYIMLDFPSYSVKQVMSSSRRIMNGNKARLFYIAVSFIPYYLLSLLSCGIAMLWVVPYQKTVFTNFYLDLMKV